MTQHTSLTTDAPIRTGHGHSRTAAASARAAEGGDVFARLLAELDVETPQTADTAMIPDGAFTFVGLGTPLPPEAGWSRLSSAAQRSALAELPAEEISGEAGLWGTPLRPALSASQDTAEALKDRTEATADRLAGSVAEGGQIPLAASLLPLAQPAIATAAQSAQAQMAFANLPPDSALPGDDVALFQTAPSAPMAPSGADAAPQAQMLQALASPAAQGPRVTPPSDSALPGDDAALSQTAPSAPTAPTGADRAPQAQILHALASPAAQGPHVTPSSDSALPADADTARFAAAQGAIAPVDPALPKARPETAAVTAALSNQTPFGPKAENTSSPQAVATAAPSAAASNDEPPVQPQPVPAPAAVVTPVAPPPAASLVAALQPAISQTLRAGAQAAAEPAAAPAQRATATEAAAPLAAPARSDGPKPARAFAPAKPDGFDAMLQRSTPSISPALPDEPVKALAAKDAAPETQIATGAAPATGPEIPAETEAAAPAPAPTVDVLQPEWEAEFIDQIVSQVTEDGSVIDISLSPENLGTVEVRLEISGGAAEVSFVTETREAARLLSQSEARLSELLQRQGFDLSGQNTSHRQDGGRDPQGRPAPTRLTQAEPAQPSAQAGSDHAGRLNLLA